MFKISIKVIKICSEDIEIFQKMRGCVFELSINQRIVKSWFAQK